MQNSAGNEKIRLGIIGTGQAAKTHLNVFLSMQNVEVAAIMGKTPAKAYSLDRYGLINWFPKTVEEMIESPEIDALVIAVPPAFQPSIALSALKNGKHILCEKPLGVNMDDVQNLTECWRKSKRVGMINFCYRLIPQIREFKARLAEGFCGHVHSIHAEWVLSSRLNPCLTHHWKGQRESGGGVLQNFGIHVLDYLFHDIPDVRLLGAKQDIYTSQRPDDQGIFQKVTGDEITTAIFDMGNGAVAYMHLSLVTMPPVGHRIIARGSKGTLEFSNLNTSSHTGPFSLWFYENDLLKGECMSCGIDETINDFETLFSRIGHRFIEAVRYSQIYAEPSIECGLRASRIVNDIQHASKIYSRG